MNGIFKRYDINDYFYAEIHPISQPYEAETYLISQPHKRVDSPIELMFHHAGQPYRTLLLRKDEEEYIDLMHPDRKIVTERNPKMDCDVIHWKFSLSEYAAEELVNLPHTMNKYVACFFVNKDKPFLDQYGENLQSKNYRVENRRIKELKR